MKLPINKLDSQLSKGLGYLYFVFGDEPLQLMEATDTIRRIAYQRGFTERVVFNIDAKFDWAQLSQQANSLSLFASQQLIELRLGSKALGAAGEKALLAYAEQPPAQQLLLISADKLDSKKQKSKWFTALDKQGVIIQVRPLEGAALMDWIRKRLATYQLQADAEVVQLIAERAEGHLLACAQEIEKLSLLHGAEQVTLESALEAVADSARFAVFAWVDTVLKAEPLRVIRQLQRLRAEGVEVILVAWALTQQVRTLTQIAAVLQNGISAQQAFRQFHIWQQRQTLIMQAVKRHPVNSWYRFLRFSSEIDRQIKGAAAGNPWDSLQQLSLHIAHPTQRSKYLSLSLTPSHFS